VFFLKTWPIKWSAILSPSFIFHADLGQNLRPSRHHDPCPGPDPCLDLHLDLGLYLFPYLCLYSIQAGKAQYWGQIVRLLLEESWLP
jgi:hypothetical protein